MNQKNITTNNNNKDLISVIIPTYNRFQWLCDAILSIKSQTYGFQNIDLIVINDFSTDKNYYLEKSNLGIFKNVRLINLNQNNCSRNRFIGLPCGAYVRNIGIKLSKGEYIAFLDDDDYWLPNKLELQINKMKEINSMFCITNSFIMCNRYNYKQFIDLDLGKLKNNNLDDTIYTKNKMLNLKEELPKLWDYEFFKDKNHATTSSCIIHKNIIKEIGYMTEVPNWGKYKGLFQDWEYWKRISKKYNCLYINEPLVIWFKHKKGLTI